MKKISVILTVLALFANFLFSTRIQTILAFIFIFSIGIIHGANDIQIIRKTQSKKQPFVKLILLYTLTVLAMGLVFFFLPKIALVVFIAVSSYHFGEQHLSAYQPTSSSLTYVFYTAYGATVLFGLLYASAEVSLQIINQITTLDLSSQLLVGALAISSVVLVVSALLMKFKKLTSSWYIELFYLILLIVCFSTSSLIWGFAIYFVFWHSLPSLLDQVQFLSGSITKQTILNYLKSSAIYWVMSLFGLTAFVFYFKDQEQLFLTLFFTFLAAITFPHVLVMHQLFHNHGPETDN